MRRTLRATLTIVLFFSIFSWTSSGQESIPSQAASSRIRQQRDASKALRAARQTEPAADLTATRTKLPEALPPSDNPLRNASSTSSIGAEIVRGEFLVGGAIVAGVIALLTAALSGFWTAVRARRDTRHATQLARLDRQLNKLYGPLYARYEAGERNWFQFLAEHSADKRPIPRTRFFPGKDDSFATPSASALLEYRRRLKVIFMPTNEAMELVIQDNPDLIVGRTMPDVLSDFLAHVAATRQLMNQWIEVQGAAGVIDDYEIPYPHPEDLKHYVRAAFEVLKGTQQKMLTDMNRTIVLDEASLEIDINNRQAELVAAWDRGEISYAARLELTTYQRLLRVQRAMYRTPKRDSYY